ncbi:hypothetical protein M0802_014151 [Mischocyttarus mexicanus]|nr:hypothetical protein M0802_014151 [Mischocyttarus mexicanus]
MLESKYLNVEKSLLPEITQFVIFGITQTVCLRVKYKEKFQIKAKGFSYYSVVNSKEGDKNFVRSTIESFTKVLSFIVARSLSSTMGLYSKSSSARILSVYSIGRLESEWLVVSGKVGPMGVAARSSTLGGDENST